MEPGQVRHIVAAVAGLPYDRIYGAWWDRVVQSNAQAAVEKSAQRYIAAVTEGGD
jgi:hypothetical protein